MIGSGSALESASTGRPPDPIAARTRRRRLARMALDVE
jgi:hypothetical protein